MKIKHKLGTDSLLFSKFKFKTYVTCKIALISLTSTFSLKQLLIPNIPLSGTLAAYEVVMAVFCLLVLLLVIYKLPFHFLFTLQDKTASVDTALLCTEIDNDKVHFHLMNPFVIGKDKARLCNELRSICYTLHGLYGYKDFTVSTPSFIDIDGNQRKAICKLAERTIKFKRNVKVTNRVVDTPWYNLGRLILILKSTLRNQKVNTRYFYEINAKV